ncbi:tryptophan-rich sensory protein [Oscillatoria sp. CS-180]|uniref:tryptophan-rich sensory protein n=1 Tax=Oscillatoria sp. CS-180 TaxID=3021720 RepID=UPI00233004CA|nr:tryptophan-rich sensory protein [Oscillatoria sp. CS-180]MDB9526037.1 tryptophan-rich sensory protein [Oscillatoria sp. CS-180]
MDTRQQNTSSGWGLAIATLLAIIGTLTINTLSNFYPPGGENVGEIANTVLSGVLITPANYAFAIWGLIYLGLIAYGIYQLGRHQRQDETIRRVDGLLITACIAQIFWIYLFTLKFFWLSILAMLAILFPLIGVYLTLRQDRTTANRQRRWFVRYPFSIYLGWISVATVVNVASALYTLGWHGGLGDAPWTVIMILVSAAIALFVIQTRRDIPFTLVFVWAYIAIAIRHTDIPPIWMTALGVSIILLVLSAFKVRAIAASK